MRACFMLMGEKGADSRVGEKVLRTQKGDSEADSNVVIYWMLRITDLLNLSASAGQKEPKKQSYQLNPFFIQGDGAGDGAVWQAKNPDITRLVVAPGLLTSSSWNHTKAPGKAASWFYNELITIRRMLKHFQIMCCQPDSSTLQLVQSVSIELTLCKNGIKKAWNKSMIGFNLALMSR